MSRLQGKHTAFERLILAECAKVLSPTNQNLVNGDVIACVRDMAQIVASLDWRKP